MSGLTEETRATLLAARAQRRRDMRIMAGVSVIVTVSIILSLYFAGGFTPSTG